MSSVAQPSAVAISEDSLPTRAIPEYLDLPSDGTPVTISVRYDQGIVFSLPSSPNQGRNLSWKTGGYALFIIFEFEDPRILEAVAITPACWFSSCFDGSNSAIQQSCCAPPVPGTYHIGFDIEKTAGNVSRVVDPKIVVTPVIIESSYRHKRTKSNA